MGRGKEGDGGVERVTQSSGELNRLWDFPRRRIVGRGLCWRKFKGEKRKTGRKLWLGVFLVHNAKT